MGKINIHYRYSRSSWMLRCVDW